MNPLSYLNTVSIFLQAKDTKDLRESAKKNDRYNIGKKIISKQWLYCCAAFALEAALWYILHLRPVSQRPLL